MDIYKQKFTQLDQEIFSLLCKKAGQKLSQREISQILEVSPTAIGKAIKRTGSILEIEKTRTSNLVSLNDKAKKIKMVENLRQLYISGLADHLEEKFAGATIILFGSYSRGEDSVRSDIDIAVIGRKQKKSDLDVYEKALERKININFYDDWNIDRHLRNNILNGIVIAGSVDL